MVQSRVKLLGVTTLVITVLFSVTASAYRFSSSSYVIDASVAGNTMGGTGSSGTYQLAATGGESIVGDGAGGSYKVGMGYIAQLPRSLTLTLQPSGLSGYYPFEEGSGATTSDWSLGGRTIDASAMTFGVGQVGGALNLGGGTTAGAVNNTSSYDFQTSDFTVEYWQKLFSAGVTGDVMGKWQTSVGGFSVSTVTGKPIMFLNNAGVYRYCAAIPASTWTHIAFVKSGATLNCYVNGVLANGAASGTPPADIGSTTQPFKLGAARYGTSLQDSIDELKLFSRALSASEIAAEYAATSTGQPVGMSLGTIIPGTSNFVSSDAIVRTDAAGYSLAINQDHDLTSGSYTIAGIASGTVNVPAAWNEGTTKGLGFTLSATNATPISGVWNNGNSYAAFPATATTIYTRTGQQTTPDYVTLKLRADVSTSQAATASPYTNTLTLTGTVTP